MKIIYHLAALYIFFPGTSTAQEYLDAAQDNEFYRCMAKRGVSPPDITKEDTELCLNSAGIPDPGSAERERTGNNWRSCLFEQAARLDDGISPANDIGQAIIRLCPGEWKNYIHTLWINPAAKSKMAGGLEKYAINEGVQAVLLTRKKAKEQANQSKIKSPKQKP